MSVAESNAASLEAEQSSFQPGPSFSDPAAVALNAESLPSWLQNFGSQVEDEPLQPAVAPAATADAASDESDGPELPTWLTAPRDNPPAPESWDVGGGDEESSFISEDDLPDWLRSISVEQESDVVADVSAQPSPFSAFEPTLSAATGPSITAQNGSGSATATLSAPTIAPAWIVSRQTTPLADGESLFASLAGEELGIMAAPADTAPRADVVAEPAPDSAPGAAVAAVPVTRAESAESATEAAKRARHRLFLMFAVVVVVLLLLLATQSR